MSQISDEVTREAGIRILHGASRTITLAKAPQTFILADRKVTLLKRMTDMESELGRMTKLLKEMRADVLHLSVE